jgi:hypothetical protein
VGDWYLGNDDRWRHTSDTVPPDPTVTAMMPAVAPPPREQDGPEHPGGDWANADAYQSYDDVDSRTVIDTGPP